MRTWTRWSGVRFFFPFDAQGRASAKLVLGHARTYLPRNALVTAAMVLLQQPLTGLSPWSIEALPTTWAQSLYIAAMVPFALMTSICLWIVVETRGRR